MIAQEIGTYHYYLNDANINQAKATWKFSVVSAHFFLRLSKREGEGGIILQ